MRGSEAVLSPRLSLRFSLQDSEFGDFLYAPIGEERNGSLLSVLCIAASLTVLTLIITGRLIIAGRGVRHR